jgi:hypothetical protein
MGLVLWRPIQYSRFRAAKDLRRYAHRGRKKESGIASRTDRAVCVSPFLATFLPFLLTRYHPPPPTKVIPAWSVSCRRLTPGPGYFEALCSDNVCVSTTVSLQHPDLTLWADHARDDRNCADHTDRHRTARRTDGPAGRPGLRDGLRHHLPVPVPCARAQRAGIERALGSDGGWPRGVPVARRGRLSEPVRLRRTQLGRDFRLARHHRGARRQVRS